MIFGLILLVVVSLCGWDFYKQDAGIEEVKKPVLDYFTIERNTSNYDEAFVGTRTNEYKFPLENRYTKYKLDKIVEEYLRNELIRIYDSGEGSLDIKRLDKIIFDYINLTLDIAVPELDQIVYEYVSIHKDEANFPRPITNITGEVHSEDKVYMFDISRKNRVNSSGHVDINFEIEQHDSKYVAENRPYLSEAIYQYYGEPELNLSLCGNGIDDICSQIQDRNSILELDLFKLKTHYYNLLFSNFGSIYRFYDLFSFSRVPKLYIPSFEKFIDNRKHHFSDDDFNNIVLSILVENYSKYFNDCINDKTNAACHAYARNKIFSSRYGFELPIIRSGAYSNLRCFVPVVGPLEDIEKENYEKNVMEGFKKLFCHSDGRYKKHNIFSVDISYPKLKKLEYQRLEAEYNKAKVYLELFNNFIYKTEQMYKEARHVKDLYEKSDLSFLRSYIVSIGLDRINLHNLEQLSDKEKISIVNSILFKETNNSCYLVSYDVEKNKSCYGYRKYLIDNYSKLLQKSFHDCETFAYVDEKNKSCYGHRKYFIDNDSKLTQESFKESDIATMFMRLYALVTYTTPYFTIEDELQSIVRFIKQDYFKFGPRLIFEEVSKLDKPIYRKFKIPLFDENYRTISDFSFYGRSQQYIEKVLSRKQELENDPVLKSVYNPQNNKALKSLLDFYFRILILPFLVDDQDFFLYKTGAIEPERREYFDLSIDD